MDNGKTENLAIDLIRLDGGTQPREKIDEETVTDYVAVWQANGAEYPFRTPCEVFHDGTDYWCADGFHRILAGQRAKRASVQCIVHKGTKRDAKLYAFKCNSDHGLRRTIGDKKYNVSEVLKDEEWGKNSSRWIADAIGVSHTFVDNIRNESKKATAASQTSQSAIRQQVATSTQPVKQTPVERRTGSDGRKITVRPKTGQAVVSGAKLVDQLTRAHVGNMVRGIDAIAKANGGKGPVHKQANDSLETLIKCLKKMRAGEK